MLRTSAVYNPTASKNTFLYVNGDLFGLGFFFFVNIKGNRVDLSVCSSSNNKMILIQNSIL